MPLRDLFHPPLSERRHWTSLHSMWAANIATDLNRRIPQGYFAEPTVAFNLEIDLVVEDERGERSPDDAPESGDWQPPSPARTLPLTLAADLVEVQVFHNEGGPVLAASLELVSPSNKDRPATRDAFVSKCVSLLQQGVGLVVVDVVTDHRANLHNLLMSRLSPANGEPFPADLYASAYRPAGGNGSRVLEVWQEPLAVGVPLSVVPLWLRGELCYSVDLEATYEQSCAAIRMPRNGTA